MQSRLIQEFGVLAVVYTAELWDDDFALDALAREDDVYVEKPEYCNVWDRD